MYLPESVQSATLYTYTMQGKTLQQIQITARGDTQVEITGNTLDSGMYLYALIADNEEIDVKRMILRQSHFPILENLLSGGFKLSSERTPTSCRGTLPNFGETVFLQSVSRMAEALLSEGL